jgi:hypothetical protein
MALQGPSPFIQQSWQEGRVFYRFLDSRMVRRSDWEDFQANRKILGVRVELLDVF